MNEPERRNLQAVRRLAGVALARVERARCREREDDAAFAALLTRKPECVFEIELLEAAE